MNFPDYSFLFPEIASLSRWFLFFLSLERPKWQSCFNHNFQLPWGRNMIQSKKNQAFRIKWNLTWIFKKLHKLSESVSFYVKMADNDVAVAIKWSTAGSG